MVMCTHVMAYFTLLGFNLVVTILRLIPLM